MNEATIETAAAPQRRARRTAPVKQPAREVDTASMAIGQMDSVDLDPSVDVTRERRIEVLDAPLKKIYLDAIKFAEDPVTILIGKGSEKLAPMVVYCACQGKGAELLVNGKWVESGWLPVQMVITTKRKYVEQLMRSKTTQYTTETGKPGELDKNLAIPSTASVNQLSIIRDASPLSAEWAMRVMGEKE